jgi:hypothetical protein
MPTFYPQQEKDIYQREIKEVLGHEWEPSTSSTPQVTDRIVPKNPNGKVSTLRELLRICIEIMKYETTLNTLYDVIDNFLQGRETPIAQRVVNQVLRRRRTN